MFRDRKDAGQQLVRALEEFRGCNPLVLAIPRGGVPVGLEIAAALDGVFSLLVTRKLPFPDNPESGFGAIAEDGSAYIFPEASGWLPADTIAEIKAEQQQEITRRISVLRDNRPLPEIRGSTVILVDDGIAMGSTMRASLRMCRARGASKVVVAAPVAGEEVRNALEAGSDRVVVLESPAHFYAVAQVYENWYDLNDEEVKKLIDSWRRSRRHE
ncbi:MAG: phosphoribosyltransferase [Candidatus Omnitrophica bacterium]|nr:phosphoribosyltransferase [Candidatus Omnitrophota bacterium]